MQITDELLNKVAALCKLEFPGETREQLRRDFQRMLDFVDLLQEVDTEGVAPLVHMTESVNCTREDQPSGTLSREAALKNAPQKDERYFRVPKVIRQ
ncbi:MAG: Asp-tRNA(Asn)/Glu-tRNA(Gln) amidotransferase subunit GatC [Bacteroidetes bacterium]|nr:MAG: Asp-tRNA(Asn)/Glu-tRNA(Gln) amidotransferase subunit GatC [Bacteroidota bacterium]